MAEVTGGTVVDGKYELDTVAGRGGMATVWRATQRGHRGFSRTVAVKHMHPHLADKSEFLNMFAEEARIGGTLCDPNIAQTYDFIVEGGNYFLIMEWVEGIDLGSYSRYFSQRRSRTRWELVCAIGIGMLKALATAHERCDENGDAQPVVHRDVSPHNILLTHTGVVKVIDFGLSYAHDRRQQQWTEPGVVKGKMAYLSPELVVGKPASPYSDQFATASVLWEALVGRKLFDGPTDLDIYTKVRDAQVQPLRPFRPDVPQRLVSVLQKALSAQPEKRYDSARAMAVALSAVLRKTRIDGDLHSALATSVRAARSNAATLPASDDSSAVTPIAELSEALPLPPKPAQRGLRHRLPLLSRLRRGR